MFCSANISGYTVSQFTCILQALKIVVATSTFGMGLEAPDVEIIIHYGPLNSMEEYIQESGRFGRDNRRALAILYHTGTDFSGFKKVNDDITSYCRNASKCRRQVIMQTFDPSCTAKKPAPVHLCCDICEVSVRVFPFQISCNMRRFIKYRN